MFPTIPPAYAIAPDPPLPPVPPEAAVPANVYPEEVSPPFHPVPPTCAIPPFAVISPIEYETPEIIPVLCPAIPPAYAIPPEPPTAPFPPAPPAPAVPVPPLDDRPANPPAPPFTVTFPKFCTVAIGPRI